MAAKKARELVQRKNVLGGSGLPENYPIARIKTPKLASYSL